MPLSQRSLDILMEKLDINRDGQIDFGLVVVIAINRIVEFPKILIDR